MAVLVVGGAGYIGSHNVAALLARGEDVAVLDNLGTGHRQAVPEGVRFHAGDLRDAALLDRILAEGNFDSVLHFAAVSIVSDSMRRPLDYFDNNVHGMTVLLESMRRHGVGRIVFSSTASVYGEPETTPITEDAPLHPGSPYGESKLAMERMMRWVGQAHGIRSVILRYFNVAGAMEDGSLGEDHRPESHLVPLVLGVPLGLREAITIFGDDYPTPDGTCIRDYIDVTDLADAHLRALDHLRRGGESLVCNLGNGQGFSVREVVTCAEKVTGTPIRVIIGPRRPGDPARLVASADRAREKLGWRPRRDLAAIVTSAWRWHSAHPRGFGG